MVINMKLSDMLRGIDILGHACDMDMDIRDVCYDSRRAAPGSAFVAIRGYRQDGNAFVASAVEKGAAVVVTDLPPGPELGAPYVLVQDARAALAAMSAQLFGNPQHSLKLVGVTGTNGKTTVASLVGAILGAAGHKCGVIGTVGVSIPGQKPIPLDRTTPESYDLYKILAHMRDKGCTHAVMEVSSHALSLHRVDGLSFEVGIFTNLTQDHLDFHGDMEGYLAAKAALFDQCAHAVVNYDDPASQRLLEGKACPSTTYSLDDNAADLVAKNTRLEASRVEFEAITRGSIHRISLGIPGQFSVYNALAAVGGALAMGIGLKLSAQALAEVKGIPGRAEVVPVPADFTVIIDFAHTPDSMENILKAVRGSAKGRIIGLFGCGGDRDRTKRPLMGRAGASLCDVCVITSDNPRSENPRAIIEEILPGTFGIDRPLHVITDRRQAIALALRLADPGDVVVLMGKGHETYQEIEGRKLHLDEREVVAEYFKAGDAGAV